MRGSDWVMTESGWRHRPWWKVAINSVLRPLQFWTDRPLIVATKCMEFAQGEPCAFGYCLARVTIDRGAK